MEKFHNILLITEQFPFGKGETFLESEITTVSNFFQHIVIAPYATVQGNRRDMPDNCIVITKPLKHFSFSAFFKIFCLILKLLGAFFSETIYAFPMSLHPKNFLRNVHFLMRAFPLLTRCYDVVDKYNIDLIYSYWLSVGALDAKILAVNIPAVSRVHRYELYADRYNPPYVPFQQYFVRHLNRIYCISEDGLKYLQKRYPEYRDKISLSLLGVNGGGKSHRSDDGTFRIVSCSNMLPFKRVDIIAKALKMLEFNVEWTHFGDGTEMDNIKQIVNICPDNVRVRLMGRIANSDVLSFYENNAVDLFVTTTSSEGLPVSIMEAASRAIPVMATAVNGIPEIVLGNGIGILLPEDITPEILAEEITKYRAKIKEHQDCGESMYKIFKEKFEAEKNFSDFAEELNAVCGKKVRED